MSTAGDEVYVMIDRGNGAATTSALPPRRRLPAGSYSDLLGGGDVIGGSAVSIPARTARAGTRPAAKIPA